MSFSPCAFGDDVVDPDDHRYAEYVRRERERQRPIMDAERWAYIRDELSQAMDPRMDGTFVWRVRSPRGRAATFTQAIDNLIREQGLL